MSEITIKNSIENLIQQPLDHKATSDNTIDLTKVNCKFIILYFYPKDNTPGCTNESKDFRDLHDLFAKQDATIFGVSRDSLKSHEKFKQKYELPFELISDPDEILCRQFQVIKEKNLFGKLGFGIERSTFILQLENNKISNKISIQHEWRKLKVKGHAQEVLEKVTELNNQHC